MLAGSEVDVVRAQHRSCELGVGVGVLQRQPTSGQDTDRAPSCLEASYRDINRLRPGRWPEHLAVSNQRTDEAVFAVTVAMREAILVGDPFLVDVRIVPGQAPHHLATSMIDPDCRAAGIMFGDRGRRDQIERSRPEAVRRAGQRTHRADLDGIAREVGLERFLLIDADLLQGAALDERDERITGDLLGKPGTACTEHAALPVQQDIGGDLDRLGESALYIGEPALRIAVRQRLVLQRALTAFVTNGTVERMVDQQEFHVPALSLFGNRRGELSLDLHSWRDFKGAGGLRLGDGAPGSAIGHLDQTLPASTNWVEQRMITKSRYLDSDELGGANDERALGHRYLDVIDRQGDQILTLLNGR
jgi:hypothetical protein